MKKLIFCILIVFAIASCSDQGNPDPVEINLFFRNTSTEPVQIETYAEGILRKSESVGPMESGSAYTLYVTSFNNFAYSADSLVISYQNNRGYICSPSSDLCISSKPSPFTAVKEDFVKEGDSYYYILSQQDYADALDID